MNLVRPFTEHPNSIGETYFQHLGHAAWFSGRMIMGGVACLVHAVLPFLFVRTASRVITELHERMLLRRSGKPRVLGREAGLSSTTVGRVIGPA